MTRHFLPLIGMAFAAAIVTAAGWLILSAFLGMGTYIETVIP